MNEQHPNQSQEQPPEQAEGQSPAEQLGLVDGEFTVIRNGGESENGWSVVSSELMILKPGEEPVEVVNLKRNEIEDEGYATRKVLLTELMSWQEPKADNLDDDTVPRNKQPESKEAPNETSEKEQVVNQELSNLSDYLRVVERAGVYDEGQATGNLLDYMRKADSFKKVDGLSTMLKGAVLGAAKQVEFADSQYGEIDAEIQRIAAGNSDLVQKIRGVISPARELTMKRSRGEQVDDQRMQFAEALRASGDTIATSIEDPKAKQDVRLLMLGVAAGVAPVQYNAGYLHEIHRQLTKQ